MELTEKHEQQIEIIIADISNNINCLKDYECCKSGFKKPQKTRKLGGDGILIECLSETRQSCPYLSSGFLCNCPLMNYVAYIQDN